MNTKKIFNGGINSDDAHLLVNKSEYINALNVRFFTSENGRVGQISNIEGNTIKNNSGSFALPAGVNTTIGAHEDTSNKRVIFFNHNSNGNHGIYCYDIDTDFVYTVILSTQVSGGLGFSTSNLIHSCAIVGSLLYWVDPNPRRINIDAGINLNHPGTISGVAAYVLESPSNTISSSVIALAKNQPAYPATVEKAADAGYVNNFISQNAFQFMYRFVYRDYEVSTFSPLSELMNFNTDAEDSSNFDSIDVTIPFDQKIPQDVTKVELAVRNVLDGNVFVIKTFTSFTAHNAQTTALSYRFYNDSIGIAVDSISANKQFESVPIRASSLEIARNRLFLGNTIDGYDTPTSTSLAKSVTVGGAGTLVGSWYKASYNGVDRYIIYLSGVTLANVGYYYISSATPPLPATFDFLSVNTNQYPTGDFLTADQATAVDLLFGLEPPYPPSLTFTFQSYVTITNGPAISSLVGTKIFKSNSTYRIGVVFYDDAGRKCGVVTSDSLKVSTEDRDYATVKYTTGINWTLINNTDPALRQAEIPAWAKYYTVVLTKNLRTNFFAQMRVDDLKYISKNTDGTYNSTLQTSHSNTQFGLAVKIGGLSKYGLGYTYQEGDILKLWASTGIAKYLKVKDVFGDYVIVDLVDLGSLSGTITNYLYEIYSPYIGELNEPYYENGVVYPISNPGLSSRTYSVLAGVLEGDVYVLERNLGTGFLVEAMSPKDIYWRQWNTNSGRPNFAILTKQNQLKTSIVYSNVIVAGSEINGLSTFDALDSYNMPFELGSIQKLKLSSKIESEGTVMLAIGEQETCSLYIGESQIFDNRGSSFLATSSGVIGNVNTLRGSFGTINPESVAFFYGLLYWFDAYRGSVVSYSVNGLVSVSDNKMRKYFRKVGDDIISNPSRRFYGGIDPYHGEVLMYAPKKTSVPQNELLSDVEYSTVTYNFISSFQYPVTVSIVPGRQYRITLPAGASAMYMGEAITSNFIADNTGTIEITSNNPGSFTLTEVVKSFYSAYDGQGGVWCYQPKIDRFTSQYGFRPEWLSSVGNRLVTFKSGYLYIHNSSQYNTFYSKVHDSVINCVHNESGNAMKIYTNISIEGDTPDLVHVRNEVPNIQSSDVRADTYSAQTRMNGEFMVKEGVSYAPILRDRLSPSMDGTANEKLQFGDDMIGEIGMFQLAYRARNTQRILKLFNIGFIPSRGHTQ